ncbi:ferroptosis suppressor protein 1-like isoform X3 [Narcine bancroftii]|uniref:ferroptosis suppressor protein 1-like isoform X3 n=1 Tax=Narcine bancroftii TaxID=1343680 RepID=UPI0038314238
MGGKLSVSSNNHVVIVGGGFGGIAAAKQLSNHRIPYTLIDIKYAFHHNMGALRASVQEGFAKKTFISYDLTFKENFKQGKVRDIDLEDQGVIMENGECFNCVLKVIHYSHLILATGSTGPFPGKLIEPVSRETAIEMYEDLVKEVTLIHSTYILGDSEVLPSVRRGVKEILVNKGAHLLLGHKVNNLTELVLNKAQKDLRVLTNKGQEIITDMVICCTGLKINSSAYANALQSTLTEHDEIIVDEHLNVRGMKAVFAIGDCAHVNEHKSAYTAEFQAMTCVKNIIHSLKHEPMELYKPGAPYMMVTMGRNDGVGQMCGCNVGKFIVTYVKSKDLLVKTSWKKMGQRMPN